MREFKFCDTCKEHHWTDVTCRDLYTVHLSQDRNIIETKELRADSHREAAVKFGKHYDERLGNHALLDESIHVAVTDKNNICKEYKVEAEAEIHYFANEITESKQ